MGIVDLAGLKMAERYISDPLDDLLRRSALAAEKVDKALERLARLWQPTVLKPGHPYLRQIHQKTGINVVTITRRYRRLLVLIEQFKGGTYAWQYRELGRQDCRFACPGAMSHTIASALIDRPLRTLAIPTPALGAVPIVDVSEGRPAGWLDVVVTPNWRSF